MVVGGMGIVDWRWKTVLPQPWCLPRDPELRQPREAYEGFVLFCDMNSDWWIVVAGMGLRIVDGSWWYGDCGLEMVTCSHSRGAPTRGAGGYQNSNT